MAKGDRLPRLLKLIHTIQSRPGLTAEELGRKCGLGFDVKGEYEIRPYAI